MFEAWADKLSIQEAIHRYARAVDRSDWEGVRAAYHSDAHDDHGEFKGTVDELIDWLTVRFADAEAGMHFIGNCLIEFSSTDTALVETYFISHRLRSARDDQERALCGFDGSLCRQGWGRYIDRFERRDGENWLVAHRTVVMDSVIEFPVTSAPRIGVTVWGRRDGRDCLFQTQADLGLGVGPGRSSE